MQNYLATMPEQRNAVKSQYHCATLLGNWEEERRGFGAHETARDAAGNFYSTTLVDPPTSGGPSLPIDANTIYTTSYTAPTAAQRDSAMPAASASGEAPRELLFYHGDLAQPTEKNLLTIQEMSYTNHAAEAPHTNAEILDLHGVSSRRDKTATLRRSMGLAGASSRTREGDGGSQGKSVEADEDSTALAKESTFIRSLRGDAGGGKSSATAAAASPDASRSMEEESGYVAPRLPPVGRVATREALLTTKNVTIDATGEHLYRNLQHYPLTSSVCFGEMMASRDNPMHKTHLRVTYERAE